MQLESRAVFVKISKFWWRHLKIWTVPVISHSVADFRDGSGPAISKMEDGALCENSEWLIATQYFHEELHLRWFFERKPDINSLCGS